MGKKSTIAKVKIDAAEIIVHAAKLPMVHVKRNAYLEANFKEYCGDGQLERVLEVGPRQAGIPADVISKVADHAIRNEVIQTTAVSALAGLPGGWLLAATAVVDLTQFNATVVRTAQKLAFIYGWPELFEETEEEISDAAKNALVLFVGVMYGVSAANKAIGNLALVLEKGVSQTLLNSALTKGTIYPVAKKVAKLMSVKMTTSIFSKSAAKLVPVAGAVLSAGLTLASFIPMAKRLEKLLEERQENIFAAKSRPDQGHI